MTEDNNKPVIKPVTRFVPNPLQCEVIRVEVRSCDTIVPLENENPDTDSIPDYPPSCASSQLVPIVIVALHFLDHRLQAGAGLLL